MRTFELSEGTNPRLSRHMRQVFTEGERVFVSAEFFDNAMNVVLMATADGITGHHANQHSYFPLDWLVRVFPGSENLCAVIMSEAKSQGALG